MDVVSEEQDNSSDPVGAVPAVIGESEGVVNPPLSHTPVLPPGTYPPDHQVGGHRWGNTKSRIGFLQCSDATLLKAIQSPPRGVREMKFYQKVFDPICDSKVLLALRKFMPEYLGEYHPPGHDVKFFRMVDITKQFNKSCIVDLKMGARTWDPESTLKKRMKEQQKFLPVKETGFQMIGMRVYNSDTGKFDTWDKVYGRSLTAHELFGEKGLGLFFRSTGVNHDAIISDLVQQLTDIENWFLSQSVYNFFACSLLMVYEASPDRPAVQSLMTNGYNSSSEAEVCNGSIQESNGDVQGQQKIDTTSTSHPSHLCRIINGHQWCIGKASDCSSSGQLRNKTRLCEVKMVDFTHVFKMNQRDDNFLFGLQKLIGALKRLQKT